MKITIITVTSFSFFITVGWLLLPAMPVRGEGIDLVAFEYEYVPTSELQLSGVEKEEMRVRTQIYTTKLAVPLLLSGRNTILLNSLTLRLVRQDYYNVEFASHVFQPHNLYQLKYGLVFRKVLSERWTVSTLVQPCILSDFDNVDGSHVMLRAGFIFERQANERLLYAIGAGYSDDFGEEKVLPVFWLDWTYNDHWTVDLRLPERATAWYDFNDRFRVGFQAKVTGGHYRVGQDFLLPNGSNTRDGRVKYSILNLGPAVGVNLYKGAYLLFNAGRSVYRRYEVFDANDNQLFDSQFEGSTFFKLSLAYGVS